MERSAGGQAPVPAEISGPISRRGPNSTCGGNNFPNPFVAGIPNEEVPGTVDEYSRGDTERGASSRAAIAAEGRGCTPASGNGLNIPVGSQHFPDPVVIGIRYKDVSETVDGQVAGAKECCVGSRTTISRESKVSSH